MGTRRPLEVTFVLVSLVAAAACAETSSRPPTAENANGTDPVTSRPATTFTFPPIDRIASPTDPKSGQSILVAGGGSCYVQSPPGKKTALPCPPDIDSATWAKKCADKLVNQRGGRCQCEVFADPPYVGDVPCPKPAQ